MDSAGDKWIIVNSYMLWLYIANTVNSNSISTIDIGKALSNIYVSTCIWLILNDDSLRILTITVLVVVGRFKKGIRYSFNRLLDGWLYNLVYLFMGQ